MTETKGFSTGIRYKKKWKRNEVIHGYLFIAPIITGLLLFMAFPLVYAFVVSFTRYGTFTDSLVFVGFENYQKVISDAYFWTSVGHAFYFSISMFITMAISLLLTVLIMRSKSGNVFKMIFFLPIVTGSVAISFMWRWMYNPLYGVINNFINAIVPLKEPIDWLGSNHLAMPSMMIMSVWSGLGINIILLFAALKNVSPTYYEAAKIDGANVVQQFFKISLPSITPVLFYMIVTGLIGSLQEFGRFQVIEKLGASQAISMPVVTIYYYAVDALETGYASTMGIFLALIILGVTIINFVSSKLWVSYD